MKNVKEVDTDTIAYLEIVKLPLADLETIFDSVRI